MFAYKSKFIFKNFKEYIKFKKNHKTLSTDITKNYEYFLFYFYKFSNRFVQKHRLYFSKSKRGFGEDAFSSINIYLEHIGLKIFWKLVCTEDKLYLCFKSYQIYTSLIQKYME